MKGSGQDKVNLHPKDSIFIKNYTIFEQCPKDTLVRRIYFNKMVDAGILDLDLK